MSDWRRMTADYCRDHQGQIVTSNNVADYFKAQTSTRRYDYRTYRQYALKYLGRLEKDGYIHRVGTRKLNVIEWQVPEDFRWRGPKT